MVIDSSFIAAKTIWAQVHGMTALQSAGAMNDGNLLISFDFAADARPTPARAAMAEESDAKSEPVRLLRCAINVPTRKRNNEYLSTPFPHRLFSSPTRRAVADIDGFED
jgi:hypothetical protein